MSKYIKLIEEIVHSVNGLDLIEVEIQLIFNAIEETNSIDEANAFFERLGDIQFVLARAFFKNHQSMTSSLKKFIYDFDRIDDEYVRKYQYEKIKTER